MTDIQERLEHYEKKDRERKEREAEIMRIDLDLFAYAKNTRYTLGDKFYRKFAQRNALILDYGKTYGTEAQERLREKLDVARDKLLARMHGMEEEEAHKNHYLQSLEYRNRIISMYRDGLEDIEKYLNEHASEHDGYRIRLDVSEIIRDVEKAVDKAGEL